MKTKRHDARAAAQTKMSKKLQQAPKHAKPQNCRFTCWPGRRRQERGSARRRWRTTSCLTAAAARASAAPGLSLSNQPFETALFDLPRRMRRRRLLAAAAGLARASCCESVTWCAGVSQRKWGSDSQESTCGCRRAQLQSASRITLQIVNRNRVAE
jgi:hypothetical protein